jgi:hypothetical protein
MTRNVFPFLLLLVMLAISSCGKIDSESEITCSEEECAEETLNAFVNDEEDPLTAEEFQSLGIPYQLPAFQASWGLSKHLYDKAASFYQNRATSFSNKRYLTIVDFSHHSSKKRFFLFDLASGSVSRHLVSHGKNSDPNNDGIATEFSNTTNSNKSSLGFYQTLGTYRGANGYSLRLRGLDATNSNAEKRAIVIHPAKYVSEAKAKAGRSWGCPALDPKISRTIINKIKGGSILLIGR